ncbi:alpha/beta fold hydrolase [Kitasatospora sp. NPDC088779]|uniref:alpha/beta hydrolase n=1 Tax=Kitasatospora sp. NPDC088779 TaxID=3154964 RepID=UPI0034385B42
MADYETTFRSLDGTELFGTVTSSPTPPAALAVLTHGAGVTREEGGFFDRLAVGLAAAGITCLRFDLRAHGASAGRFSDITIAAIANDIRAASEHLAEIAGRPGPAHVIAASFSGGAAALHAGHRPDDVDKLNGTGAVEPGRGLRLPNGQFGALRTVADRPRSGIAPRLHQFHRDAQFASCTRASRCSRRSRSHSPFAASNRTKARMVPSPSRNHSPPCSSRTR